MVHRDDLVPESAPSPSAAPPQGGAGRIAIISAGVGAGHDGAAAGLAERLAEHAYLVDRHDFLELLPTGTGRLLRGTYHRMLTWMPDGYQRLYAATDRAARPGAVWRALFRAAERRTLRALAPDIRAVVSTYPGASQVLGALRRRGKLTVPAFTYLTDFSVHTLWVAPASTPTSPCTRCRRLRPTCRARPPSPSSVRSPMHASPPPPTGSGLPPASGSPCPRIAPWPCWSPGRGASDRCDGSPPRYGRPGSRCP
ncbi:hypothetical protein O1M54_07335 [Streptomyces diastatochromogenes]|nr:hypothetical protein [Streptomyces diastatochromogenes]